MDNRHSRTKKTKNLLDGSNRHSRQGQQFRQGSQIKQGQQINKTTVRRQKNFDKTIASGKEKQNAHLNEKRSMKKTNVMQICTTDDINFNNIKNIRINLLNVYFLLEDNLKQINNKTILITGGTGSFGNAVYIQTFSATGISMQVWSGVANQVSINSSGLSVGQNVTATFRLTDDIGITSCGATVYNVNNIDSTTNTTCTKLSGTATDGIWQVSLNLNSSNKIFFNVWSKVFKKKELIFKREDEKEE